MTTPSNQDLENKLIGKNVDNYIVDEYLGYGNVGDVYRVHYLTQPTIAKAMKVYKEEFSSNHEFSECFHRETENLTMIQENELQGSLENIVRIFHTGTIEGTSTTSDNRAYFVMEYMDSGTLEKPSYPDDIDLKEKLRIFAEAANGLIYAHKANVDHLDVHANNIFLHKSGKVVKIGDFAVSALISPDALYSKIYGSRAIKYVAPELYDGKACHATDTFQLGATMLEIFTGIKSTNSGYESLEQFVNNPIPDSLKQLIRDCLKYNFGERPSAEDIKARLLSIRTGIIKREEMHQTFLNGTTRTLERICGRAKSNKCKTLIAPDVEELYNNIYDCMNRMEDEGFDSPFDKLDEVAMQQLDIDLVVMTDFAKIYDSGDIMTVKPKIADLAKLYKDALTIWSDRTGLKFIRVLPDYTIRRE